MVLNYPILLIFVGLLIMYKPEIYIRIYRSFWKLLDIEWEPKKTQDKLFGYELNYKNLLRIGGFLLFLLGLILYYFILL